MKASGIAGLMHKNMIYQNLIFNLNFVSAYIGR
jgi:hypothetical protein